MKIVEEECITVIDGTLSPVEVIREITEGGAQEDPFYVMDLGEVVARYHNWVKLMPRVEPFYAVKCNNDKLLLSTLAGLGANFDCASKVEIDLVTCLGVKPERIIFAHPAKMKSHIRHASAVGVTCMTFDSMNELVKIKESMPHAQLVIRIRCDSESAQFQLGNKFGCDPATEAPELLKQATVLGLEVVGVSFHAGSGTTETAVYGRGVALCRELFGVAHKMGHSNMHLVDIGGGFPGATHTNIIQVSQVINAALDEHFPERSVRVIGEPGRYFAAAACTLAACVYAKRAIMSKHYESDSDTHIMYFINDGVYGSLRDVMYEHHNVTPEPLYSTTETKLTCSVWGPTCDARDCVIAETRLPALNVGEWLLFRDMGAYTLSMATSFNGFPIPKVHHVVNSQLWSILRELPPLTAAHFVLGEYQ